MSRYTCIDPKVGKEQISKFLSDDLTGIELRRFEAHLLACRSCQDAMQKVTRICEATRQELSRPEPEACAQRNS